MGGVHVIKKISRLRFLSVAAFSCLFAYLLSFVFEGQVLYGLLDTAGVPSDTYILSAIIAHFVGLFSCGFFVKSAKAAKHVMFFGMLVCLVCGIPFFFECTVLWLCGLIVSGFTGGLAVASWGFFLKSSTPKSERIKACADVLINSNILMILINVVAINASTVIGLVLSLLCLVAGCAVTLFLPAEEADSDMHSEKRIPGNLRAPLAVLFLFVAVITVNSGMMYQVINPTFEHLTALTSWYWAVPYVVALLIMRNLPVRAKRSRFLYAGMAMIMTAFICLMLMGRDSLDYVVIDTLMLGACGIFDLFWWSIIGEMLDYTQSPAKVFGIGLSANVFGVLCGDILGMSVTNAELPDAQITVIALIIVCVTLVILPPLNSQLIMLLKSHAYLSAYSGMSEKQQTSIIKHAKVLDPLTEREKEVLSLILDGKSNREIAAALFISENTVKTHAKNIYSKYDVGGRAELISTLLKNQDET